MISPMSDSEHLSHIRHSLAHLLAASVLELYPDTKLTLGPAIDTGFYYDMDFGESPLKKGVPHSDAGRVISPNKESTVVSRLLPSEGGQVGRRGVTTPTSEDG